MSEEQNRALVKSNDPQLVTVPTQSGSNRLVARGADGKFASKHKAAVKKSIRSTIDFLEGKDEDGDKTRAEKMREALYKAVLNADPEDLVGMSKAIEAFNKFAFGSKGVDKVVEQSDPGSNEIRVIMIPMLPADHPSKKPEPTPTKPSWIDAEVVK